ncbi:MAG: methionine--tRNA ligase, partial [Lachnospiraceae bacterium]|nr:methionine--tRNA ligase [Lachnospiraceae bacterium]
GMYCKECEAFYTASQIVDGKCPDCGMEVHPASEEAYFFRMSKYSDRLIEHIETHPGFIQPESRKNEMMNNFLKPGLQDLCVSRTSFTWGIPVDFDPKHVVYVWLDALSNYITGLGYDADGEHGELYKKYWPADIHVIGKDIIRFHTIYWPIFLMALGEPLPKQVLGHPWLLLAKNEKQDDEEAPVKMSKSRGNVIYADDLVDIFGVDAVRYYVLHEMPFDNDGTISWELVVERVNSDLANTLGNLVNRTISMTNKYFGGEVRQTGAADDVDADLKAVTLDAVKKAEEKMEQNRVADALTEIFNIFRRSNKYIDETMPWALAKDEAQKDRLAEVLYNLTEAITIGASLLAPFLPETGERILAQLGAEARDFDDMDRFGLLPDGTKVTEKPEILFARMDTAEVLAKADAIAEAQAAAAGAPGAAAEDAGDDAGDEERYPFTEAKEQVGIDDFAKLQFRVGEIIACEKAKKSKKLLVSQVKIGRETRQIVSGIAKQYTPEEMVGKKVVVITNLKPAVLAGYESQGMILCAEDADGNLSLLTVENAAFPGGSEVG